MGNAKRPGEFELIRRYFAPLAAATPAALGLGDDAAILTPRPGQELVVTTDALVASVHFLPDDPPDQIARKMLRENLSDLAAKGAAPIGYLMSCAFDHTVDEAWIVAFCAGLAADQAEFGVGLLGGDTVGTPGPLTLTVTALGEVPAGRAMRRNAAKADDLVFVSGTLGDSALGLKRLRGGLLALSSEEGAFLIDRYRLPQPRLRLGRALMESGLAKAALDVSDGLIADLGHIGEQSDLAAEVERTRLPLSPAGAHALDEDPALIEDIVAGGEDYELLFTASAAAQAAIAALAERLGLRVTPIGRMMPSSGQPGAVRLLDEKGREIALKRRGWQHF
ncbi:thiamine-phosphate kinase [Hypericibacter sp.]|uniref:thiamine-phosphate kinase n=1 Tax=Hypericibacter sp. TaxID=2705401 RepID=UPI003D6CB320